MILVLLGLAVAATVAAIAAYCYLLDSIYKERLSTDEVYLVTTGDLWQIRVCRYRKGRTNGQPVVLVHGANVNQHNFTAPRGTSLVDYLVDRGFDCWTVDLRGCRSSIAPFERHRNQVTTDDHLNEDLPTLIRFVQQETGYAHVHYCGHSLGGMLLYAYVLKYGGGDIASAVTLGSPLGFEGVQIARSRWLIWLLGIYPPLFGSLTRAAVPIALMFRFNTVLFPMNMRNLAKGLGAEYLYTMLEDPLPGVLNDLGHWANTPGWTMDGGKLDVLAGLKDLDFPLFALYAPLDPFVSVEKGREFVAGMASRDKRIQICSKEEGCKRDYGHCDLAFGLEGQREVFAPIARWFEAHSSRERMPVAEPDVPTGYQRPLDASQRAEILSGDSFAHLAPESPAAGSAGLAAPGDTAIEAAPEPEEKPPLRKNAPAKKRVARKKAAEGKATAPQPQPDPTGKTPKGPDLASVTAALTALRPPVGHPRPSAETPITVTPVRRTRSASGAGESAETPNSVLKALSKASNALDSFKKKPEE